MTWSDLRACVDADPDLFYPEKGENWKVPLAKKVCAVCPVMSECREAGLYEKHGVWGGLTVRERRRLPRPERAIDHGSVKGHREHLARGETSCRACEWAAAAAKFTINYGKATA